jgi:DNA-binding MarR family transcriptional regulator
MTLQRLDSAGYLVNHAGRLFALALARELGPHGAWPAYFPVLLALWEREGRTQAELVPLLNVEQPTLANTIGRMVRDGLVRRTPDPEDRRAVRLHLTAAGRTLEAPLTAGAQRVNARALHGLSRSERSELLELLRRIITNLQEGTEAMP